MEAEKKKPGRPRGSKNKPALARPQAASSDPITLVQRNLEMIDWAQRALRVQMQREMESANPGVTDSISRRLVDVSNALVRSVDALKKTNNALEELQKNLTPAQLFEGAVKRIKAQGPAAIREAIKRLKDGPGDGSTELVTGAAALASLGDDE